MTRAGAFLLAAAILIVATPDAQASGIGASPDVIEVQLTRSGIDTATLLIFGGTAGDEAVTVAVEGDIAGWISIEDVPGEEAIVPFDSTGRAVVTLTAAAPDDAANGTYEAIVTVRPVSEGDSVTPSIVVPVVIEVLGDAVVAGDVDIVIPPRAPAGEPTEVAVAVENVGTVRSIPEVTYTASIDGSVAASGTSTGPALLPEDDTDITVAVDHGAAIGDEVRIEVEVAFDGEVVASDGRVVAIVDPATLGADVVALDAELVESADPGGVATITASFVNTGATEVATVFRGRVEVDGEQVDTIESIRIVAAPGATETVDLFVPIESEGAHRVVGRWDGQDPDSSDVVVAWQVGSSIPIVPLVAVGVLAVVALLGFLTVRYRRAIDSSTSDGRSAEYERANR